MASKLYHNISVKFVIMISMDNQRLHLAANKLFDLNLLLPGSVNVSYVIPLLYDMTFFYHVKMYTAVIVDSMIWHTSFGTGLHV